MKRKTIILLLAAVVIMPAFSMAGCGGKSLKDGYYTAETAEYSHGWKEYLRIQVKSGEIMSAEFNGKNESGFIKAWDNNYMKNMISEEGTYPNKYTREYVQQLIDGQDSSDIDVVSGASHSGENFVKLAEAVLECARRGDSGTKIVE